MNASVRICAKCEWIFKGRSGCPKCGFGTYGAFRVYGNKAYGYMKTQKPWLDRKVAEYKLRLLKEIKNTLTNNEKDETL